MKSTIYFLILILTPLFSIAQSRNWKQIETPFSTSIYILHQTSQGYLFGKMNHTNQIFFSKNKGLNWSQLPDDFAENHKGKFIVREDKDGNLFHASKIGVHSFNPVTLDIQQIIAIEENSLLDFAILNNNNFVVGTNRKLLLCTSTGNVINQHDWSTHSARFLLDQDGQKHFVLNSHGAVNEIVEFNNDLSFVGEDKLINVYPDLVRKGQRFYRGRYYSDDRVTWNSLDILQSNYISANGLGHDGQLYFVSNDKLFISSDDGTSIIEKDVPLKSTSYVSSDLTGEIVISQHNLAIPEFYLSQNSGESWTIVPHNLGLPYMEEFTAGVDENLYCLSPYIYPHYLYKKNEWTPWKFAPYPDSIYFPFFTSISNGFTLALSNDGKIHETLNKGAEWQILTEQHFGYFHNKNIVEKSGVLVYINFDKMFYSSNSGIDWDTISTSDTAFLYSIGDIFLHAPNFGLYTVTRGFPGQPQIIYYNFLTKEKIASPDRPDIYPYATSYNENLLYGLKHDQERNLTLCISNNFGRNFSYKTIEGLKFQYTRNIKTDHLNNIYVYTDKDVYYSFDEGDSWQNITPNFPGIHRIKDLQVSYDNYIYVSTVGKGILKFNTQLLHPKTLNVTILDDQNKNCEVEDFETSLRNINVLVNGISLRQPDESGLATFRVNTLINEIKVIFNPDLFAACEPSYTVEFEDTDTELHLDIPLKVLKYCADPVVGFSTPFLRRCFDNTYSGSVCNEGSIESINTEIEITLDPFFDFISATLPIKSINGQIVILDAGHLQPGQCQSFHFVININCDAGLGQEHCVHAFASTGSVDCDVAVPRDAYVDCQQNIGAYDPNDKNIFVNGNRNQTYIETGDKIEYLIRFQNTGTDTAFTVRIEDPITQKFDVSTIKPVAASHPYTWSVNNGMLVVLFEDIQLVDSFKNEPASHGFIKFEIQLDSLTVRGDEVKNLAGIFFDFNEPIITEEVVTAIGQPLSTIDHTFETIQVFPNPANKSITLSGNMLLNQAQNLQIYDIHGRLVHAQKISQSDNQIDLSRMAPGTYMLMITSGNKVYRGKVVKM